MIKTLRGANGLALLAALLFLGQTSTVHEHLSRHSTVNLESAPTSTPVLVANECPICDGAHAVPEAPQMVTSLGAALLARPLPLLSPVAWPDTCTFTVFGARAPPVA